jgi:DNA (cytosine-5)-methyltransferase 1
MAQTKQLVLSTFTGVGLLDKAFREIGFVVVSAGDIITGQDIREFHSLPNKFDGLIGGPPCQDFSGLNRNPSNYSDKMLQEFKRIVLETKPKWWMMENVANVPNLKIEGYSWQRFDINQGWYDNVSRLRHIQFGSTDGLYLDIPRGKMNNIESGCALASDDRSFKELCALQGLDNNFDLPSFNVAGKKKAVGNGVPLSMGRVLVREVLRVTAPGCFDVTGPIVESVTRQVRRCECHCGRAVAGRKKYYDASCRKRAERSRKRNA